MPKNRGGNNGFYWLMSELKDKHPRKYPSMRDASDAAGDLWKRMTPDQKRPYEDRAKLNKNNQKIVKYTTTGQSIDVVQRQHNELVLKEQYMKDDIEKTINLALATGELADLFFNIVHVNFFCFCNTDKRYYPAEIAVARFSLQTGITPDNVFDMICKIGKLPMGYLALAKKTSEETHQIPPPMLSNAENNIEDVANMLLEFLRKSVSSRKFPPLYADKKNMPVIENILLRFRTDYDFPQINVYSLEHLFYVLRNSCSEEKTWAVSSLSELELEKDKYEFCREISCSYHEISDVPNHCSKSHVIRTTYTICDNCCADMNIDLIPGQHVPKQADLTLSRSQSRATSTTSTSTAKNQPSRRHAPLINGYLSREETDYSEMSETSTVVDPNDFAAVGGLDSDYSQADTAEWHMPKSKKKGGKSETQSSIGTDESVPGGNRTATKHPLRRPVTLSAGFQNMSISREPRGRGRGIAANFYPTNS